MRPPFFIVGVGRSGTTLLRTILNRHPDIAVPSETQYLARAGRDGIDPRAGPRPPGWDRYLETYLRSSWFVETGVPAEEWRALVGDAPSMRDGLDALLTIHGRRQGAERVGEKTPAHWQYMDILLDWYPEARVIVMVRDPRAVVASQLRTPWVARKLTPRGMRSGLLTGKRTERLIHDAKDWRRIATDLLPRYAGDERIMALRYEDLVDRPGEEIGRVLDFLGADPVAGLERGADGGGLAPLKGKRGNARRDWREAHYAASAAPVTSAAKEKWRDALGPVQIALVESICVTGMRTLGYDPVGGDVQLTAARMAAGVYGLGATLERRARR